MGSRSERPARRDRDSQSRSDSGSNRDHRRPTEKDEARHNKQSAKRFADPKEDSKPGRDAPKTQTPYSMVGVHLNGPPAAPKEDVNAHRPNAAQQDNVKQALRGVKLGENVKSDPVDAATLDTRSKVLKKAEADLSQRRSRLEAGERALKRGKALLEKRQNHLDEAEHVRDQETAILDQMRKHVEEGRRELQADELSLDAKKKALMEETVKLGRRRADIERRETQVEIETRANQVESRDLAAKTVVVDETATALKSGMKMVGELRAACRPREALLDAGEERLRRDIGLFESRLKALMVESDTLGKRRSTLEEKEKSVHLKLAALEEVNSASASGCHRPAQEQGYESRESNAPWGTDAPPDALLTVELEQKWLDERAAEIKKREDALLFREEAVAHRERALVNHDTISTARS